MNIILKPTIHLLSRPQISLPVEPAVNWIGEGTDGARLAEFAGRLCYLSWKNPSEKSTGEYLDNIKKQGHGSVTEHANYSVFVAGISRSLTHEWVRHRAGWAYSQLSQRYVNESDTAFVLPPAIPEASILFDRWYSFMTEAVEEYKAVSDDLFDRYAHIEDRVHRRKTAREAARSVLPNATETALVATANVRAWRWFLQLRGSEAAEREIRRLAVELAIMFIREEPQFFGDVAVVLGEDGHDTVKVGASKI